MYTLYISVRADVSVSKMILRGCNCDREEHRIIETRDTVLSNLRDAQIYKQNSNISFASSNGIFNALLDNKQQRVRYIAHYAAALCTMELRTKPKDEPAD